MRKRILSVLALAAAAASGLFGQNMVGTWQGTLQLPNGRGLRTVVKVTRAPDETLKAVFYSIDQSGQGITASAATQQGAAFKMTLAAIGGSYEGKLDGDSINGTFTQGGNPLPLNFVRATPATEWAIPDPPPPPRAMAADANPGFEVSTIKPSNPDTPGRSMLVGRNGGNTFTTTNSTMEDLITFAYGIHAKQLSGGPSWLASDRFDITAKPDHPGIPNVTQLRTMVQKLLAERFQLAFHKEKKELSCYTLTVAKAGVKMAKSEAGGRLPGFGGRGPGSVFVRNSTMAEFAEFLQSRIVERPVVDQTGLADRFDFTLQWTPDPAQLAAAGPNAPPPPPANADAPPDLFTAMRQQLGIQIESTKAPVEVLVIDKVAKPSEN